MVSSDAVRDALRQVVDPELGRNVVDLGFIKGISVEDAQIHIQMVLSVPSCPLARILQFQVRKAAQSVAPDAKVTVELLDEPWTPPWESAVPD